MKDVFPYRRICRFHFNTRMAIFPILLLSFFVFCDRQERQVPDVTFTINIQGFSLETEEFNDLKSVNQDIFNGFIHKYSPGILIFTAIDGTEFSFNTGSTTINNFRITLPAGEYSLSGMAQSGGNLSEDAISFLIPMQDVTIEELTTEIDINVTPSCMLVIIADEDSLVEKAYVENESNPFYIDGIYSYSYVANLTTTIAYIVKKDGTQLEFLVGKSGSAHIYQIIVTVDGTTEIVIPDPDDVFSGSYTQYRGQPPNGSIIDARGGVWSFENGWIATPNTSSDIYWVGGEFFLTVNDEIYSPTDAWEKIWHHNGGWTLKHNNVNWVFDRVNVRHVGDAFNITSGTEFFTIKNSYVADIRDDAVQNDEMYSGNVSDNFFDGVYVGFSARAWDIPYDGHLETWTIQDNLIWIKPMYSVFKGDSPGNGQIIKWQENAPQLCPHLIFRNNIVRVGKKPFQSGTSSGEAFYFPPDCEFDNNILVWDGELPVPQSLKNWFNQDHNSTIGSMVDWDNAVQKWYQEHPYFQN